MQKCGRCPFCMVSSDYKYYCILVQHKDIVVLTPGGRPTEEAGWCNEEYADIDMRKLYKDIKGY